MRSSTRRRKNRAKRERISVYQRTYTKDAYGQKTLDPSPECILESVPAWFEYTGGTETFRGQQLEASVAGVFEIRLPSCRLTTDMYITHENDGDRKYEIVFVKPVESMHEGGFRELWLFVKAYANA